MIKIAITGGICSGKTTVCKYLEELGYKVYYSDEIAKELIYTKKELQKNIINEFGDETFIKGKYNSEFISNIVFKNSDKLNKLNEIFKPFIDDNFKELCNKTQDVLIYESALIFEHKKEKEFDFIISTYADLKIIIERMKYRNNYNDTMVKNILQNQMSPLYKNNKSNFVIDTSDRNWKEHIKETISKII